MFRRYGNPSDLLRSQSFKESLDFLFYLFDEEDKEELKQIWLSKDFDMNLPDFLNKYSKKRYISDREKKARSISAEEEARVLARAMLFVTDTSQKGG